MAGEVGIRSFVARISFCAGGQVCSPQTATGHMRNR